MSLAWLSRLVRPQPTRSSPARRRWPRLWLEALEDRWLLATVTTLLDDVPGSLREAIALTPAGGTVDFEPGLSGTITLTAGQHTIDKDLTLAGPGASVLTVSGNNAFRVFEITSAATVTIAGLTIANGRVTGVNAQGGGILNAGTLTVTGSTLSGNSATGGVSSGSVGGSGSGGGIFNAGARLLTITNSTLSGNSATGGGGGGFFGVRGGNGLGGGIFNAGAGPLTVTGSTLSGNSATGGPGGGVFGGGPGVGSGGGISGSVTALRNTIIAGNTASSAFPEVNGPVGSQGHNLVGVGDGGSGFLPTDLVGTAAFPLVPLLGPLQDNGGPTPTHLPLPGSPAVDAGDNADAPATDQRGFPRVAGGVIDIGAVERPSPISQVFHGDFNGDGKEDVAGFTADGRWLVSTGTPTGFNAEPTALTAPATWANWSVASTWKQLFVADFNNDNRDDVAGFGFNGQWHVGLSNGSSFQFTPAWAQWSVPSTWRQLFVGHFSGTDSIDVAGLDIFGRWWVGQSLTNTPAGSFAFQTGAPWAQWSVGGAWSALVVGDFQSNGKLDVAGLAFDGSWWLGLADDAGTQFVTSAAPWANWGSPAVWTAFLVADFNAFAPLSGSPDVNSDVAGLAFDGSWWLGITEPGNSPSRFLTSAGPWVRWLTRGVRHRASQLFARQLPIAAFGRFGKVPS